MDGNGQSQYAVHGFVLALPIGVILKVALGVGGMVVFAMVSSGLFAMLLASLVVVGAKGRNRTLLRVTIFVAGLLVLIILVDRWGAPLWLQVVLLLLTGAFADWWSRR